MVLEENFLKLKVDVAQMLLAIEDSNVLEEIYNILLNSAPVDPDWYENLDAEDKEIIREGEEDLAMGRVVSQEDLMKESKTWKNG